MACMTHHCRECGETFFDNEISPPCPECGSRDVTNLFDEAPLYDSTHDMEIDNALDYQEP